MTLLKGHLKRPGTLRLGWRIILPFAFLTLILGLAGTYITTRSVSGSLGERFDNQLAEVSRVTSDSIVRRERKQLETLRAISLTGGVGDAVSADDVAVIERLAMPIIVNSNAERAEVLDRDGNLLFGARQTNAQSLHYEPIAASAEYSNWPTVRSLLAGTLGDTKNDKASFIVNTADGPVLYTAGLLHQGDSVAGLVLVGAPLSTVLGGAKLEALGDVTVYTADGAPVASTFASPETGEVLPKLTVRISSAVTRGEVLRQTTQLFGRNYDLLYSRLQLRDSESLIYSVALPSSFIAKTASLTRWRMTVLFTAATLLILVTGSVISRSITRPLLKLAQAAEAVSAGDLSVRSGVDSHDEIGTLARAFDEMTSNFQRQHLVTIKALVTAIDARDPYTRGHSWRVGQLSRQIGQRLGLTRVELQFLEIGGYLHDIGTIGLPDSVLLESEALTSKGKGAFEAHVNIGLEIIDSINFPKEIRDIVGSHHERLDGSGYPLNLSGGDITLSSRIAAVADTYDTITTRRPDREVMNWREALVVLERDALLGRMDLQVVDALREVLPSWELRSARSKNPAVSWDETFAESEQPVADKAVVAAA